MKYTKEILIALYFLVLGNTSIKAQNGTVKDFDGNVYKTVKIGTQIWMAENLKTTHFNDGTDIPYVTDNKVWSTLTTAGYCWYDNNPDVNKNTYGALYNWYAVSSWKLCPKGWHVPTDEEWTVLVDFLGGEAIAGKKMKNIKGWKNDGNGNNSSKFTGLPGGHRSDNGSFDDIAISSYWWSASVDGMGSAYSLYIYGKNDNVFRFSFVDPLNTGMSIRCIKDSE